MKPKLHHYKGAYLSLGAISRLTGISQRTLYSRIVRGMSIDAAISEPTKKPGGNNPAGPKPRLYEFRGKHLTIAQIAGILGCGLQTVYNRRVGARVLEGAELEAARPKESPSNARLITYKGKTGCLASWARKFNLSANTIRSRLNKGWSVEHALRAPRQCDILDSITFNGRTLTLGAWAKEVGMSRQVLRGRINLGWSVERALTEPVRPMNTTYSCAGKNLTVAEWARESGVSERLIRNRLDKGWSFQRALTEPKHNRGYPKTSKTALGTGAGSAETHFDGNSATGV